MADELNPEQIVDLCTDCATGLYKNASKQLKCKDLIVIIQIEKGRLTNGVVYERNKFIASNGCKGSLENFKDSANEAEGLTCGQAFWLMIQVQGKVIISTVTVPDVTYKPGLFAN